MARVTIDGQGIVVGGRRAWIVGAELEYALIDPGAWPRAISLLRQSGFNTVRTSVPWSLHERRRGQRRFDGPLDLRSFVEQCADAGLWVIARLGPVVGGTFSGGGLPSWLGEIPGLRLREPNDAFLRLVAQWFDAVLAQLKGLDAPSRSAKERRGVAGGLAAVQVEHEWNCGHAAAGTAYLRELRRYLREGGVELPMLSANGLWTSVDEIIDLWEGDAHLFSHARQLHQVQPGAPVIVEIARRASLRRAGSDADRSPSRSEAPAEGPSLLAQVTSVLAAGGQPIVAHAGPERHRLEAPGVDGSARLRSDAVTPQLVTDRGLPTPELRSLSPLALFASRFGAVLGGNGGHDAVVVDPDSAPAQVPLVLSRTSAAGSVAFVLRSGPKTRRAEPETITLVTEKGLRLPVRLGSSPVTWLVVDLDLQGQAHLDYSTLAPIEFIDQSLLVLRGAAGSVAPLSIGGSEVEVEVPADGAGATPAILAHAGVTLVVCNEAQASAMRLYGRGIAIGADLIDSDGSVVLAPGFTEAVRVESNGRLQKVAAGAGRRSASPGRSRSRPAPGPWSFASAADLVDGSSDRYASTDRPRSLAAYAPSTGLGWYRLRFRAPAGARLWFPDVRPSLRLFLDGRPWARLGDGDALPLELPAAARGAEERTLSMLAVDRGRPIAGLHQAASAGPVGGAWIAKPLRPTVRGAASPPFDPFSVRAFVPGAPGPAHGRAVEITLRPAPKEPVVVSTSVPFIGALLVDGELVDMVEPSTWTPGGIVVPPPSRGGRRGDRVIMLAPLRPTPDLERAVAVHALVDELSESLRGQAAWAFARWEAPPAGSAAWSDGDARSRSARGAAPAGSRRGLPAWWRCRVPAAPESALTLDGLTRGAVLVNGVIAGRYEPGDDAMLLPARALDEGAELLIFDEEGAAPDGVRLVAPAALTRTSGARSS